MVEETTMASSTLRSVIAGSDGEIGSSSKEESVAAILARHNEDRCQQILECKRQMAFWKAKLEILEAEQERCLKLQRVKLDPAGTWRSLSRAERMDKTFILAALNSTTTSELPEALDEFLNTGTLPSYLRMDRELFLARVARDDIAEKYQGERLFVPPKLRGDKEVVQAVLAKHPAVLEVMACELRDDNDIFAAVVDLAKRCPGSSGLPANFLQHFSMRIRSDRTLMLRLCTLQAGVSSMGHISSTLRNDKDFMMQVFHGCMDSFGSAKDHKGILRFASARLQDDKDLVLAAVRLAGLNLKYATPSLRRDRDVVIEAVKGDSTAFRFCLPGEVKNELLRDRHYALEYILKTAPIGRHVFRSCLDHFPNDREVVLQAVSMMTIGQKWAWSLIPEDFRSDRAFIKEAIQKNAKVYLKLPEEYQKELEIALCVCQNDDVDGNTILEATERCPALLSNHDAMLAVARCWWGDVLHETLQFSPIEIRSNKDIMMEAVANDFTALDLCSDDLQEDRDIVLAAVESLPPASSNVVLFHINDSFQRENPDIVALAIQKCRPCNLYLIQDDIDEELWLNREVALAWLSAGGDWLEDDFPDEFKDDEDLLLTVAESNWDEFDYASTALRNSKDFMLRAIEVDARVIRDAGDELRHDHDLALRAFSKDIHTIQFYSNAEDFDFMVSFTGSVRRQIQEYDHFQSLIFTSIAQPSKNPGSSLSSLNQGPDSVQIFTHMLASYVGLPDPSEVKRLRDASSNLLCWGF